MKKLLSCLLTASMTVMMLPVQAHAETITDNVLIYQYDELSDYYVVTGVEDTSVTSVTIPAEYNTKDVVVESNVFAECKNLTEIHVERGNKSHHSVDGVLFTDINLCAYPCAKPDTEYTVPEGITRLMPEAFTNCTFLRSVTFSDSVMADDAGIFRNCPALEEINGIVAVTGNPLGNSSAILNCPALKSVHFGLSRAYICPVDLSVTPEIKTVTFEEDVVLFTFKAKGNHHLKELTIPSVGENSVWVPECGVYVTDCENLESLHIRNNISPAQIRITNCPKLKEIIFDKTETGVSDISLKLTGLTSLSSVTYCGTDDENLGLTMSMPMFCGDFTVYSYEDNKILKDCCENYQIPFVLLSEEYSAGDVTGDTKIDILDVVTINKAVLGKESLTNEQIKAIDFNGNGKPDASDSLTLMKYIVGLIETLI